MCKYLYTNYLQTICAALHHMMRVYCKARIEDSTLQQEILDPSIQASLVANLRMLKTKSSKFKHKKTFTLHTSSKLSLGWCAKYCDGYGKNPANTYVRSFTWFVAWDPQNKPGTVPSLVTCKWVLFHSDESCRGTITTNHGTTTIVNHYLIS